MAKLLTKFVCSNCGAAFPKWSGKCEDCNSWNTISEEPEISIANKKATNQNVLGKVLKLNNLDEDIKEEERLCTGNIELDRVLGGGLVKDSVVLIGGEPGIGKSTILLELASFVANLNLTTLYISGEESLNQIRARAARLGLEKSPVKLICATSVSEISATISSLSDVTLVIIDSIQTVYSEEFSSSPGTVTQVRATASTLSNMAKQQGFAIIFVGHVNKDGQIAGPKVLEHMVDTVLYFEGERGHHFRIVRAVKNRFGAVNEIGVFEMTSSGIKAVTNPSELFLSGRSKNGASGSVVFAGTSGSRPILVEVQSLLTASYAPMPRRAVIGWDNSRLSMILAIISTRYGINLADKEVYLNIAGGIEIDEPALDLAAICSIISSYKNKALSSDMVVFGEVGLSGEVRMVNQMEARLKEASKLGFKKALVPAGHKVKISGMEIIDINHVKSLGDFF